MQDPVSRENFSSSKHNLLRGSLQAFGVACLDKNVTRIVSINVRERPNATVLVRFRNLFSFI